MKYSEEAKLNLVDFKKESSFDIIQKLDKDILEKNDNNLTDE